MSADATLLNRRHFLSSSMGGLGNIALAWLMARDRAFAAASGSASGIAPLAGQLHHRPRAKRIVQVFCCGGVSHLDTFDYKPELERLNGTELKGRGENLGFFGQPGRLMKSVYPFRQHGQSGAWVSDLLPNLAGCVDDLCFIHSMFAKSNNHTPATFQMNSGFTLNGFPCMGAWLSYGLGTENENLPAFVVLPDPRGLPAGGSINWTSDSCRPITKVSPFAHSPRSRWSTSRPPRLFPPTPALPTCKCSTKSMVTLLRPIRATAPLLRGCVPMSWPRGCR